ncbi:MAG: pantoate--beta-alanine ligase [Chloroflexi bacterium]|nr:pantoate--beta-alanine ligase [Chloroflexota bacterium]
MIVEETVEGMRKARRRVAGMVGFVPTMGYLHEGHLALVRRARQENDFSVASIFVNPTQFGPQEDFQRYPRDPERDLAMLSQEGVDLVFLPSVEEIYPAGFGTYVEVGRLGHILEGASRPDHFRGVATVVAKLFHIVQPTRAYFGQKDAQQVAVIERMVADLNMDVGIVRVPTVREADGLAMSSRNVYLSPPERQAALVLWRAMEEAKRLWESGRRNGDHIREAMRRIMKEEPLAIIDYVSVADAHTLEELEEAQSPALVSLAVWIGKTRLIDNMMLE